MPRAPEWLMVSLFSRVLNFSLRVLTLRVIRVFQIAFFPCAMSALILLTGCVPSRTRPETEQAAATAIGVPNSIQYQTKGGPIDTGDIVGDELTFAEAIRLSLQNDPSLQSALSQVRVAQAEADQSRLFPNPILSVAARFPEGGGKPTIDVGLTADFISMVQRPGRVGAADNRLRAASADAVSTVLDVLQGIEERYAAVQTLDELMPVLEARRTLLARLLEIVRSRLRQGEGTQLDVLTIESQVVELDLEIAEKQLERNEERLSLARLIGQPSSDASWKLDRWQAPPEVRASERNWISAAIQHRPEIQARQWELAALGDDLSVARWAAFDGADAGLDSERDGDWSFGPAISLPLPIFDWGQGQRDKIRAQRVDARHKLTQESRQVVEEVRRAYTAFAASTVALDRVRQELLPLAERRQIQAEAQFKAGQTDITALMLAEQDLQAARAKLVELQRKTAETFVRLQRAVGGPGVAPDGETAPATLPSTTRQGQ
jgi:cobalt-zinc-cadmium efflux system outer membrane protein